MKHFFLSALFAAVSVSAYASYDINFPADANITHSARHLNSFTLNVEGLHGQLLSVGQQVGGKLYFDLTDKCFVAQPGKAMNIIYDWTGTWMNSYVYLDRGNDGEFNVNLDAPESDDLLAYSHYKGQNSAGTALDNGNHLNVPQFVLPADLAPGTYRMRVKIDWDSVDPAGSTASGNDIRTNGGVIVDAMILVSDASTSLTVTSANGSVTLADGSDANGAQIPASGALNLTVKADDGYQFDGMTVTGGFELPQGITPVASELGRVETTFNALNLNGDVISIPVEYLSGHAVVNAMFIPAEGASAGRYASAYDGNKATTDGFRQITVNGSKKDVASTSLHTPATLNLNARIDEPLNVAATFSGNASKFVLSIDYNQDGVFNTNTSALSCEVVATAPSASFGQVNLPVGLRPGVYRARIEAEGHSDVDFFLNVHRGDVAVRLQALNALVMTADDTPVGVTAPALTALKLTSSATLPGFEPSKAIVRHGQNLGGPEFVCGNPQWADSEARILSSGNINIPSSVMNGDVEIYVLYDESETSEWTKVWGDEFNSGKLDGKRWQYQPRAGSTWNRFVAQTSRGRKLVNTFEDGYYNSHCFATPAESASTEGQPMISGAIMSQGRFSITYGKIEARIKTTPHTGNFPAFWMMPAYSELADLGLNGWPRDGEIDIWEQIDAQDRSHHTVHSGWTGWNNYCHWEAPKVYSPASSGNVWCDANLWHVYALEWDADELRWFVDGKQVFSYRNQHYSEPGSDKYIEKVTWPFDKNFYIILNQSVGNGSWAANVDESFHYLTLFDYVRVYQKKGENRFETSLGNNGDDADFYVPAKGVDETESSIVNVETEPVAEGPTEYFDLNGRRVGSSSLVPGVYIEKTGAKVAKIIIR